MTYKLEVYDMESNWKLKVWIWAIFGSAILFLSLGVLWLVKWRNHKLQILARLKAEIIKFRNRAKNLQPFAEEQHADQGADFEIPKEISDNHTPI